MSINKHQCIKPECSNSYEDEDPDAYYCEPCQEVNKRVAAEVDAKVATKPKKQKQQGHDPYAGQKTVNVKGMTFLHVKL